MPEDLSFSSVEVATLVLHVMKWDVDLGPARFAEPVPAANAVRQSI
jgi:hypothetical protein